MDTQIGNTVCETTSFLKAAKILWSQEELERLKIFLALNPLSGDEIPGTGGLRKLRWARAGMGKRGGARVVYYYYNETAPLYLLYAYAKSSRDDLSQNEKTMFSEFVAALKNELKKRKEK